MFKEGKEFLRSLKTKDITYEEYLEMPEIKQRYKILPPSNIRADAEKKLKDYAWIDVRECWLVSSEARTLEILKLSFNGWERLGL
ncbi:MAG TPA: hypothetical protein VNM22_22390 [Candidatus Limnocylindrales bacterium]|nr:hypothetical protein [Candidatus Limnocylindrales bacterium]